MSKREKIMGYLHHKVSFIYERLMVEILSAQPEDVIDWSIKWLDTKGRDLNRIRTSSQFSIPEAHRVVKDERLSQMSIAAVKNDTSSDDEDDIEDLPVVLANKKMGQRTSVSAEAYGQFNKKEDFVARVIPKEQEQKDRILKRLLQSFMFQALDDKEQSIVVNAMEEKKFSQGDWVIKQGEDGDELYVVDSGELDCFKCFKKGGDNIYLKTYKPGESFGELSLLYNAPRAASIQAKTEAITFALDRATFNNIVKDAAIRKRQKYENVLKQIDLLASMDPYETTQVCDGIKDHKYNPGEYVIREGEKGDIFYMIEEGTLIATKTLEPGKEPTQVYQYKPGEYFGELALLKNIPRQANVIAVTEVKVVFLDQSAFKRLLGPVEDILKRNASKYEKYMSAP